MSSKEFTLFSRDQLSIRNKFYYLMDLLITNQNSSRSEALFFMIIFYTQMISGFYSEYLGILKPKDSTSDKILNYIEKIIRLKDLFNNKYSAFKKFMVIFLIITVFFTIHFIVRCFRMKRQTFYTFSEVILNFYIKFMIYIGFNIVLDCCFSSFCLKGKTNPYFKNVSCSIKDNLLTNIISIFLFILSIFFTVLIQFFYCDSMYLSTSFYSRIACNYELITSLNCIVFSFLLTQVKSLSKEIFLIYNFLMSIFQLKFFLEHYLFYDTITNTYAGLFHILYLWTSIFFLIFAYIHFKEIGIIYLVSSIIILYFYFNLKYKIEENVFLDTPFYKISNKFHLLYYIKNMIDKMNHIEENPEDKALLSGIMQMHELECPSPNCITKKKKTKLYLPITNEWSDRSKLYIEDRVFMINFIVSISDYFINENKSSPDLIINLSLYYLEVIGNYCQAMFYYKKVKEMKLTLQEQFSFVRLKLRISKLLVEKLKPANEPCENLEDLNVTLYFKYEDLSQNFVDEINNDINLSLEFWKIFRNAQLDATKQINFNKIFQLTDKIRITKTRIELIWEKLINIYNGVNELFDLYFDYVEQINDDDLKKRDLESLRRKNDNLTEHLNQNYFALLFNRETGLIIANADKGKEGLIVKTNTAIENIFRYKPEELKGMNLTSLMPKIFAKIHKSFMEKYYNFGEKKIIDKKDIKTFGKDKDNAIVVIRLAVKLFPMLNDSVYFVGMITKENIDDVIFLDHHFNIQGMSSKLLKVLNCDNKILFQNNEIPFYVICKKFVNFYKIFLQGKKQNIKEKKKNSQIILENLDDSSISENEKKQNPKEQNAIHVENIEINENIELEYEIRLPQFLIDFSNSTNKRLIRMAEQAKLGAASMTTEALAAAENAKEETSENDSIDEFGESDLLVDDNDRVNVQETSISKTEENVTDKRNAFKRGNLMRKESVVNGNVTNFESNYNNGIGSDYAKGSFIGSDQKKLDMILKSNSNANDSIPYKSKLNDSTPTPYGDTPTPGNNDNKINDDYSKINQQNANLDFNKKSDEEKDFISKIKMYKDFFYKGKFDELDELIDDCNRDSNSKEYKFNFTFDRHKFGQRNMSYIVRCIDAKNEGSKSDEESIIEADENLIKYKKEKAISIKPLFEVLYREKELMIEQESRIENLQNENYEFQKLLNICKEDINKMSLVHGKKQNEKLIDENASQSSHASFNADLVKKNRIEEIRANLLKNISNFFTLRYIKIVVIGITIFSLIYGIVFIILFNDIYFNLNEIGELNINLFQSTIWMANLIGTMLSLRALYNDKQNNDEFYFNSYINNITLYYETMEKFSFTWYNNITDSFGKIEDKIGLFISDSNQKLYFWDIENVTYDYEDINGVESFPLSISQSLSNINSVLKNDFFTLKKNLGQLSENSIKYINYISFMAIENTYENVLPNQFNKLKTIPKKLKEYNTNSNLILFILILGYSILMIIFCGLYTLLLHITNKNMGEGLEKVSKIKLEKIEDTIKTIQGFNVILKLFREKEAQKNGGQQDKKNKNDNGGEGTTMNPTINPSQGAQVSNSINSNGFNLDAKKFIPLKILNISYFQTAFLLSVLLCFLIPIYLLSNKMVNSTNQIINVQEFLFGKILVASSLSAKVKCFMSECRVSNNLNFTELITKNEIQKIVQGFAIFSNLNDFYNEKFRLNACAAVFADGSSLDECLEDELIKSGNNTESLLKLISEIVDNIYKDFEMKNQTNIAMHDGSEKKFKNIYLFESESFKDLEYVFYKYIAPVSNNFAEICLESLKDYLGVKKKLVVVLIVFFCLIIFGFSCYIGFFFVRKLIYLLSVSRSILKIIPTSVIYTTQELDSWI